MFLRALTVAALAAAPALATEPKVYSLTPAERDAAIANASRQPESTALLPDPERDRVLNNSLYAEDEPRDRKVHGEMSMFIGTGGARGIAGTVGMPIGESGFAQFSFNNSRYPRYYNDYQPYRWQQQRR
ncbi:hypothetical protein GCM10011529_18130 [Polymorphobacter glacialis]|uniref:Uncharacterized protein n=1 Tax=Sandarakinorhabdus glacialis TaxID=1614636 RepID=A0A916ZTB4_9SPHN|nr:hypothetical protein [Polymorphobacter glacialis]GGE12151.1 hypothetical protein GCM10011529_18130 [Polymorphobacter glacialis]